MFTNILRRRGPAVLAAGAAAAAVLARAVPAGGSTGARQTSPEQAGYTANHAQFKEIDGNIYLRDPRPYAGMVARYGHNIQLWSADRVVSLNLHRQHLRRVLHSLGHHLQRTTHQVIASDPNAEHRGYRVEEWSPGVGGTWHWDNPNYWTSLSISYSPATGHLKMTVEPGPDLQGEIRWSYNLPRQSFTKARIGTNFGTSPWDTAYTYAPPAKPVKSAVYTGIRLTSYSGHKDDLSSWWMHHKLLALADRNLVAFPDNLAGGGASFHTWFAPKSAQSSS